MTQAFDPTEIRSLVDAYCAKKGALAVGIADVGILERMSPPGHGPRTVMPKVRSVISIGVGGGTAGAWAANAKTLAYVGDTETLAYKVAFGLAFYIESTFGYRAVFCPPDIDPEQGARIPMQSMKLHAEVAGIGARSMAGDILLHPEFGMLYYSSVFTEMPLVSDGPMAENPCPHPSCVELYRKQGRTPCQKFCPAGCLSGTIDANGRTEESCFEADKCAEMSQQYEAIPGVLMETLKAKDPLDQAMALYGPESQAIWYKLSIGAGELLALCFECMRVCPIAQQAPLSNPLKRGLARRKATEASMENSGG